MTNVRVLLRRRRRRRISHESYYIRASGGAYIFCAYAHTLGRRRRRRFDDVCIGFWGAHQCLGGNHCLMRENGCGGMCGCWVCCYIGGRHCGNIERENVFKHFVHFAIQVWLLFVFRFFFVWGGLNAITDM